MRDMRNHINAVVSSTTVAATVTVKTIMYQHNSKQLYVDARRPTAIRTVLPADVPRAIAFMCL